MRNRCVWMVVLVALGVMCGELRGQTPAVGAVTVSFNEAVMQTGEAQKQLAALETKYAARQAKLKALNDQVTELQKQLQAAGAALSDAERANREQSLAAKQKQLQRDAEDYKTDTQTDTQEVFQSVAQKMFAFLQKYATQQKYPMVVERGSDTQPVVWFAAANVDITEELVKAYDVQSGIAAPAAAKPSLPSAPKPQTAAPKPQ